MSVCVCVGGEESKLRGRPQIRTELVQCVCVCVFVCLIWGRRGCIHRTEGEEGRGSDVYGGGERVGAKTGIKLCKQASPLFKPVETVQMDQSLKSKL